MTENERIFLIAEYDSAWKQILNIDERRSKFISYYNLGFLAVLAFIANIWSKSIEKDIKLTTMLLITSVLISSVIFAFAIKKILISERNANIRYRKKVNLIREIFLINSSDPYIIDYIRKYEDIGIKTAKHNNSISKLGDTLTKIFRLINLQICTLIFICIILWLSFIDWFNVSLYVSLKIIILLSLIYYFLSNYDSELCN